MRSTNLIKNVSVGMVSKLLSQLLSFVVRTVFIYSLSKEFLGINGLFSSILAFLNLTELGLGSAIVYALYKPLAQGDEEKIRALMKFYRSAYAIIGGVIAILGLGLLPALPYLIKNRTSLININIIYIFFLFETVASYWFWAYKSSLLIADQKEYLAAITKNKTDVLKSVVRIVFLLCLRTVPIISFYVYTALGILFTVFSNWRIGCKADRLYPFLRKEDNGRLSKTERNHILKNVLGLSVYRVSGTINNAIDTLLISAFIGIAVNGVFSNYELLVSTVNGLVWIIVTALIPSVGNLNSTESGERQFFVFRCIGMALFWIYSFCGIALWVLLNPFIGGIWLDNSYLLSESTVFIIFLNFITGGMLTVFSIFIEATGNFAKRGIASLASAAVNVLLSVLFLSCTDWGIAGAILATVIARMVAIVPLYPRIVAKDIFHKKAWKFYGLYAASIAVSVILGGFLKTGSLFVPGDSPLFFVLQMVLCVALVNGCWYLVFRKTREFGYMKDIFKNLLNKLRLKNVNKAEKTE